MRWLLIAVLAWPALVDAGAIRDEYDAEIREAAERYLPGLDWRLYKAQLYQESRLDPEAESHVGAKGIAQFMPATWNEIAAEIGYGSASPRAVEPAIQAGAYYMADFRKEWSAPRPSSDRYSLSAASYNAGLANVVEAQQICGGPNRYRRIIKCLPEVTGEHAKETRSYVSRIWRWFLQLMAN